MCDLPVFFIMDRVPHGLAQREGNKPGHSFQILKFCWHFLVMFSSRHYLYIKGRFCIDAGTCFGGVVVAIDTVLRSLK